MCTTAVIFAILRVFRNFHSVFHNQYRRICVRLHSFYQNMLSSSAPPQLWYCFYLIKQPSHMTLGCILGGHVARFIFRGTTPFHLFRQTRLSDLNTFGLFNWRQSRLSLFFCWSRRFHCNCCYLFYGTDIMWTQLFYNLFLIVYHFIHKLDISSVYLYTLIHLRSLTSCVELL